MGSPGGTFWFQKRKSEGVNPLDTGYFSVAVSSGLSIFLRKTSLFGDAFSNGDFSMKYLFQINSVDVLLIGN